MTRPFQKYDLLLTPVAPTTAPKLGESLSDPLKMYLSDIYTVSVNLAGLPGLSMPCGFDSNGLPIGAQLIGPALGDLAVLDAAHAYQQETDWHKGRLRHGPPRGERRRGRSMTWETVIGLETHVELATRTKIFCSCTTEFGGAPNTHCCPVCTGMPGTLPVLNQQVVELAVKAGLALNCAITPVQPV